MKKLAALIVLAFSGGVAIAQDLISEPQKSNTFPINSNHGQTPGVSSGTAGDTLMYFEGYNFFLKDPNDAAAFSYMNIGNNASVASALSSSPFGSSSSFVFFYSLDANNDTINYIGATSWFLPIGQANNWFTFGPVTIPSSGATLRWQHSIPNNSYRDGYKIKVSTTGRTPSDFVNAPIFGYNDQSPYTANDTDFVPQLVELDPSYNGQQLYFAFHHDAQDMFILYLDEIMLTAGITGVKEEAGVVSVSSNRPNPAHDQTWISYSLRSSQPVSIAVYDIAGKEVKRIDEGSKQQGSHTVKIDVADLAEGVYYYTVNAGGYRAAQKMIISR